MSWRCGDIFFIVDGWTPGYTFHGDAGRVFKEFFGGDNPFAGMLVFVYVHEKKNLPFWIWLFLKNLFTFQVLKAEVMIYLNK